jgi:hypothetical protein
MDWHRLFGLVFTDMFTGSPFVVELEKDLSLQQQFLDVVVVRRGNGRFRGRLPDGLTDLAEHNLLTFKSRHEALDDWVLMELTGHFVSYRKLVSPSRQQLLPVEAFRLYAICSNFPHNLNNQVPLEQVQEGVYNCRRGTNVIRVIVVSQLPALAHNTALYFFSRRAAQFRYAVQHYQRRSPTTSSLLYELFRGYRREGGIMPYTMEDFKRDFRLTSEEGRELWRVLTSEERRELLSGLTSEERRELLRNLPPAERREILSGLPINEVLESLPRKEIEKFLKQKRPRKR